jgi:integrase
MTNSNHPKQGDSITVEPIRNEKDIKRIKSNLLGNKRDYLLFVLGINNGLRGSDLLSLKVGQLKYLQVGEYATITEQKTGKTNIVMMNKTVKDALQAFLNENEGIDDGAYLFASRKGDNKPLTVATLNHLVKVWTTGINGNFGSHSLRKTFGYIQRVKFGTSFEILAKRYQHSNPAITMRYLGISSKEVNDILMNEI